MTKTTTCILMLALTTTAFAATDEQKCLKQLGIAGAKYEQCILKEVGKLDGGGSKLKLDKVIGKCVDKYALMWPKLVDKFSGKGTSCAGDRYLDNVDGTFYDRLTRLTWEKKTDDGSIHDKDTQYTWSTGFPWREDGSVFTSFLKTLNDDGFGGSSGWRIPSFAELYTLIQPAYPTCETSPCTTVPGDTAVPETWSSSTALDTPDYAFTVDFERGDAENAGKDSPTYVRAVRGGF